MKRLNLFFYTASVQQLHISHLHYLSSPGINSLFRLKPWMACNARLRFSAASHSSGKGEMGGGGRETIGWYGDEGRHVRVSVWWDFENCSVPVGVNVYKIAPRILAALRTSAVKGPITIYAYGDIVQLSRSSQEALVASGICLSHVPRGGKDSADRALLVDLVLWTSQNPPPAHLFLISGDGDFSSILHRLRMKNYNILVANSETSSTALYNAASIVWQWSSLVRGKKLLGKQFNHPPDGNPGSWYGEPIGPVEDAFRDIESEASSNTVPRHYEGFESESNQESDWRPRQIPETVMAQIADILYSYPKGLSIAELQSEIVRNGIEVDKNYYGHKKFSRFLLAMRNILNLYRRISTDGKTWTYYAYPKFRNTSKTKIRSLPTESADGHKEWDKRDEKVETTGKSSTSLPNSKDNVIGKESNLFAQVKETNAAASGGKSDDIQEQTSKTQKSFIGRVLGNWFGIGLVNDSEKVYGSKNGEIKETIGDADDGNNISDGAGHDRRNLNVKYQNNLDKAFNMSAESRFSFRQWLAKSPIYNSSYSEVGVGCELKGQDKGNSKKSNSSSAQILSWLSQEWKGWLPTLRGNAGQTSPCHGDTVGIQNKSADSKGSTSDHQVLSQLEDDHVFSNPEFWNDVKSYLQSNRGSAIVSKAKSREDMINMLQKEGPLLLCNLGENNLHHLINILVEDKKWLEEGSQKFPFRLTIPGKGSNSHPASTDKMESLSSTFHKCMPEPKDKNMSLTNEKELRSNNNYLHDENVGRANGAVQCPNFEVLKEWLITVNKDHGSISITKLETLFNEEFNKKFDSKSYGFSKVEDLLASFSDEISMAVMYNQNKLSRTEVINNCQKLLDDIVCNNPDGCRISSFKSLFFQRYGYTLDQKMLGYAKLSSFLKSMPRVEVQYDLVYSTEKFLKREHDREGTSSCNLEQSCEEQEGTIHKDTGTEERARWICNLEHSSKMQEGRTLEDSDPVERADIEEKRRLIDDLEQSSEEQGDRVFKDPGIEKRIHTEERKPGCHDFTDEGILTSVETVNDEDENWEELGPIVVPRCEERGSSSNEKSLQYNCSPDDASQMQLQKDFDLSSPQFCGYSDPTVCDAEWTRRTDSCMAVEGQKNLQREENNSSLQTLDVLCKDSEESSLQKQSYEKLDGLVDCSVRNNNLDSSDFLTAELGRSSLTMSNSKNQMKNRKRQVLFQETATNLNNDAAASIVDSILSALRKSNNENLDKRSP